MQEPTGSIIDNTRNAPLAPGLDPVTGAGFAEIVAPRENEPSDFYRRRAAPIERQSAFTPMTWVMIVVAGVVLGFAVTMMLAGA